MQLDTRQINNLCTGVKLAAELRADEPDLRKFLTVQGYTYDSDGKAAAPGKVLHTGILDQIYFELRCYEISKEYYVHEWDVTENDFSSGIYLNDIKGVDALESELEKYIDDFSVLKPEWYCDNLL